MIENLPRELGDPPRLGLAAGIRYHLTTYGIWGFAMISSPTWRSAIDSASAARAWRQVLRQGQERLQR